VTVDERLADWLERTTPEPPNPIALSDVAMRVPRRRRPWLPLLAAACIVLVAAIAVIVASRSTKHDAAPPAHRTTTRSSPSPHPKATTTRPRTQTQALPIRPWGAHVVRAIPTMICPCNVSSDGTSIYATDMIGGISSVWRINPDTGEPVAQFRTNRWGIAAGPVFADGQLWLALDWRGSVHLQGFDPTTFARRDTLPAMPIGAGGVAITASGSHVFLASGHRVAVFDIPTRTIAYTISVPPHPVSAVTARGDRLDVGTAYGAGGGAIYTYDISTRSLIDTKTDTGPVAAIAVTAGGLWVTTEQSGMEASVNFNGRFVQSGGGGVGPTVGVFGSTAWLGGTGAIQCADADTGAVRARAPTQTRAASEFVTSLVVASGRVFAEAYATTGSPYVYLVELHPPAACR
jgi:DNA-binding beta-propeller fold protein YncE